MKPPALEISIPPSARRLLGGGGRVHACMHVPNRDIQNLPSEVPHDFTECAFTPLYRLSFPGTEKSIYSRRAVAYRDGHGRKRETACKRMDKSGPPFPRPRERTHKCWAKKGGGTRPLSTDRQARNRPQSERSAESRGEKVILPR